MTLYRDSCVTLELPGDSESRTFERQYELGFGWELRVWLSKQIDVRFEHVAVSHRNGRLMRDRYDLLQVERQF